MLKIRDKLDIPREEKLFIDPDTRVKVFYNLIENYKVFCEEITLIYAYLNYDSELRADYLLIFKYTEGDNEYILWDAPYLYTNRTTPAFKYVIKNDLYEEFFHDCKAHMCNTTLEKFMEFIKYACGLSVNPNADNYWKNPDNGPILLKNMLELSLQFRPF